MIYSQDDIGLSRDYQPIQSFSPARKKNRSSLSSSVEPLSLNFSQGGVLNFSQSSRPIASAPTASVASDGNDSNSNQNSTSYMQSVAFLNDYGAGSNSMSQFSQLSQDFAERLGHLHVRCSQENHNQQSAVNIEDSSFFIAPQPRSSKPQTNTYSINKQNGTIAMEEKEINIHAPIQNPFLSTETNYLEQYFSRSIFQSSLEPLKSMWVGAFRERSRYLTDFTELQGIGEGTFSVVYVCRHRLDGQIYVIKKCKERIASENHEKLLLREVHAYIALQSNPHVVRYYNAWIEDAHLYIQLECCAIGNLEDLIAPKPSKGSLLYVYQYLHSVRRGGERAGGYVMPVDRNRSDSCLSESMTADNEAVLTQPYSQPPLTQPPFTQPPSLQPPSILPPISTPSVAFSQPSPFSPVAKGIEEDLAWVLLYSLSEGVKEMHKVGLVHLDLRPANLFLSPRPGYLETERETFPAAQKRSLFSAVTGIPLGGAGAGTGERGGAGGWVGIGEGVEVSTPRAAPSFSFSTPPKPLSEAYQQLQLRLIRGEYVVKIGDLGHCRGAEEGGLVVEGESRYCPRELINSTTVDLFKADVFSLAMSVYELCLGRYVGKGEEGMVEWHSIRDGILEPSFLSLYSPPLVSLLLQMLHPLPAVRPPAQEVWERSRGRVQEIRERETGQGVEMEGLGGVEREEEEVRRLREENVKLRSPVARLERGEGK